MSLSLCSSRVKFIHQQFIGLSYMYVIAGFGFAQCFFCNYYVV